MSTFAGRLAAKLQCRRGQFTDRDIQLVAAEIAWDAPGWCTTDDFYTSVAPFVADLPPEAVGWTRARVFAALPDMERQWFWEMVEAEVDAAPRSRPSAPVPDERDAGDGGA